MVVRSEQFASKDGDFLTVLRFFDYNESGALVETGSCPFYCHPESAKQDSALVTGVETLPSLLENMYRLGREGIEVEFQNTDVSFIEK